MSSGFLTIVSDHDGWSLDVTKIQTTKLSILLRFYFHGVSEQLKTNFQTNLRFKKVLLVSVRHVAAHPDELQHGVSLQSCINLGKTFPWTSRIRIIPSAQILAKGLCIFTSFHFPDSGLYLSDGFDFYFDLF